VTKFLYYKHINLLKLFPGITPEYLAAVLEIKNAVDRGIIILDVTQCSRGSVEMGR